MSANPVHHAKRNPCNQPLLGAISGPFYLLSKKRDGPLSVQGVAKLRILRYATGMEAGMQRQMTITVDETVYEALRSIPEQHSISDFLADMVRMREMEQMQRRAYAEAEPELEAGYRAMAADEEYERNAKEWINGLTEVLP
jgi:predicted CopG family antitoxin